MEKRKDHFSDWQLPSQTSFNKRGGKKKPLKGQPAASLPRGGDLSALHPLQGSGWAQAVTPSPPCPLSCPGAVGPGGVRPWQREGWGATAEKG